MRTNRELRAARAERSGQSAALHISILSPASVFCCLYQYSAARIDIAVWIYWNHSHQDFVVDVRILSFSRI